MVSTSPCGANNTPLPARSVPRVFALRAFGSDFTLMPTTARAASTRCWWAEGSSLAWGGAAFGAAANAGAARNSRPAIQEIFIDASQGVLRGAHASIGRPRRSPMKKLAILATAVMAFAAASAVAQAPWPSKPVKIVAVFPPGGSVDQVARLFAAQLTQQTGQQFVVENKGGASGSIGAQAIATSPPDGYTFGVVFDTHAVNPSVIPNLAFDTVKDLASVMLVGTSPMAVVTHVDQPYKSFRDVLAAAKDKPVSFGRIGTGSLGHLAMLEVGNRARASLTHIPYRGGGPLMNDAVGNQVPLAIGTVFLVTPHVKGGKLRALAVTSDKPSPQLPGVATIAEQGVPGFSALAW